MCCCVACRWEPVLLLSVQEVSSTSQSRWSLSFISLSFSLCRFQNSQKEMIITKLPEVCKSTFSVSFIAPCLLSLYYQVLCIHLKRFRFDAYFSSKISRHIAFPLNDLDMGSYLKECEFPPSPPPPPPSHSIVSLLMYILKSGTCTFAFKEV